METGFSSIPVPYDVTLLTQYMEPEFAQIAISNDQALTLLDMYLCAKATDSRDLVQIYGHKILSELAEIGLIKSDQQGRATTFCLLVRHGF